MHVAWFGGEREGADDVAIWAARSDGASAWSVPEVVADARDVACWNPVLHAAASGGLLLFYKAGASPQTWSGRLVRSLDGGLTWSAREPLPPGIVGPAKNKPVQLGDVMVCGSSTESYKSWGCWIERTLDEGRTWTRHGPIHAEAFGMIQPALFAASGERLVMVCRTRGLGTPVRCVSRDGGLTWTRPEPIDVPHSNSGLDAIGLADGRAVLACNPTTTGRTPLELLVSDDDGVTWARSLVIEDGEGEHSYPSLLQARDGTIHVVWTWRRERIAHAIVAPGEL